MQSRQSSLDDVWDRVRQRLTSPNVLLIREVRRLLDLPQPEAVAAITPLRASADVDRLRLLFTVLANVSQKLLARDMDQSSLTFARQQTATCLANLLGDWIKALGHPTKTLTTEALAKQAAYVALVHRFLRLADWTESSQAEAEQIIVELEQLLTTDPPHFLAIELREAVAIAWTGIGDYLADTSTPADAAGAYLRAIQAFATAEEFTEARMVRLRLLALSRVAIDFDELITQISAMLDEIENQQPNLQQAELRLELAETYALVDDYDAASVHVEAAEMDSWRCGWPQPDLDDINSSFVQWVAHAEAICNTPEEFSEVLFTELTVEQTALALRARISANASKRDACLRAAQEVAVLEKRLREETLAVRNSNAAEQAAFTAELGDAQSESFAVLPTDIASGQSRTLREDLDAALRAVRAELISGASGDSLIPEVERIIQEARAHSLVLVEASALSLSADIHIRAGRFEAATKAASAAFGLARDPHTDIAIGLRALDRVLDASIASDDPAAISGACGDAVALIERHRDKISAPYSQSAFFQQYARYYTMGIDTAFRCDDFESLVQRADAFKAAGSLRNFGRSANVRTAEVDAEFRDLTEQIELARQNGDAGIAVALVKKRRAMWDRLVIARARAPRSFTSPPLTLAAVHAAIESDEAVISWCWLTRDVLMIIAVDSRRIRVAKHKINERERRAIDEFADAVQSLQRSALWIDQVRRFSATLLPETIHPVIVGKRRLILSPHRVLHALPLHALAWDGDLLIRRFAVSYAPNLSCLTRQHHSARKRGVLAVGISEFAIPGEKLKPLPDCVPEAKAVAATWTASNVPTTKLFNEHATTAAVRTLAAGGELARLSCLHFATHGADVRGDNPMEAHLWLHDGRLDGLEIAMWQLEADLVVLSACHSGQRAIARHGRELMGDDIFGLQAALFTAGAARVLGALWPADSPTAAILMADFHRRYAAGDPPEIALQAAMLAFLDNATPLTRAAYYWAPFYIAAVARPAPQDLKPRSTT
jgi:CHAT domain-containing protein